MKFISLIDTPITSGTILVGEFSNVGQLLIDLEDKLKEDYSIKFTKTPSSADVIRNLYDNENETRLKTFALDLPFEQRDYTLMFVDQVLLMEVPGETLGLIAEKRPLKLILNIHLHDLFSLTDLVLDAIFGNYSHYVIGKLSYEDERILEERLPLFKKKS